VKKREHIAPNLTPIIDIVFLILIFFMVSSTFKKDELALLLTLPKANSATSEVERDKISIELSLNSLAHKGKEVSFEELENFLSTIDKKEQIVNVRIDEEVDYGRVTRLFDVLNKYALNNLALENTKK